MAKVGVVDGSVGCSEDYYNILSLPERHVLIRCVLVFFIMLECINKTMLGCVRGGGGMSVVYLNMSPFNKMCYFYVTW